MVYVVTLIKFRKGIQWRLILGYFDTNIQQIFKVENILSDILIRIPAATYNQSETSSTKDLIS